MAVILLTAIAGCSYNTVRRVSADDFAVVREGRYEGNVRVRNDDPRLKQMVEGRRQEIEADPVFLHQVAGKYFSVPDTVEFRFMYVGEDSAGKSVVLRYFGFAPKPFIIAGWQVQFVLDPTGKRLKGVYTQEVPLE